MFLYFYDTSLELPKLAPYRPSPQVISDYLGGAIPAELTSTGKNLTAWVCDDAAGRPFNGTASAFLSSHDQIMHVVSGPCVITSRNLTNVTQPLPFTAEEARYLHALSWACHRAIIGHCLDEWVGMPDGWCDAIRRLHRWLRATHAGQTPHAGRHDPVAAVLARAGIKVWPEEDDRTLIARLATAEPAHGGFRP